MTSLVLENDPLAVELTLSAEHLAVDLADGRRMLIPLVWYPRLKNATKAERQNWQLLGGGYAIEWPDLDEHIGVEGLLAGRTNGESAQSLKRWLASRAPKKKTKYKRPLRKPRKRPESA